MQAPLWISFLKRMRLSKSSKTFLSIKKASKNIYHVCSLTWHVSFMNILKVLIYLFYTYLVIHCMLIYISHIEQLKLLQRKKLAYHLHVNPHLKKKQPRRKGDCCNLHLADKHGPMKFNDLFDALNVVGQGQDVSLPKSTPFLGAIKAVSHL